MRRLFSKFIGIVAAASVSAIVFLSFVAFAQPQAPSSTGAIKFPIAIDATRLSLPLFIILSSSGELETPEFLHAGSVQTVQLAPGDYLYDPGSTGTVDFKFTITTNGTVDYDHKCDAFLSGRGTKTLHLTGFEVTLDALSLTGADNGGGVILQQGPPHLIQRGTLRLLPHSHYTVQQTETSFIEFGLGLDGRFFYSPELDVARGGSLSGAGATTLTFKGYAVSVDATAVSHFLLVREIPGAKPVQNGKTTVVVLPALGFTLQLDSGPTTLGFSVGRTGAVTFDPAMTGLLDVVAGNPPVVRVLPPVEINVRESVLTQHNDNGRTGAYLAETLLKPSNVDAQNFGELYTLGGGVNDPHIGAIVAQPLFVKNVNIGGLPKDVLYVATRANKIYAFDVSSTGSHDSLWNIELPVVPLVTDLQPITAVWRESDVNQHLDLFATASDGSVISNFWERSDGDWHNWFAIRPDTGRARPGTPQQITAVWGDPNNPQHLNLFMTDQDGTIKNIFCTLQPGHPCWGNEPQDPVWFPIGATGIAAPGQPVTAVWRDGSHLDLFVAGRDGQVLTNFFESNTWHDWIAIRPDTGRTKTGTPQQITAVWGDPNNPQHLNLFMTDQDGTIKSIVCTLQPGHPCWGNEPQDPVWFPIGATGIAAPGQPVTAVWRDGSHLDLFVAGRDGQVLTNFFESNAWHDWFAIRPDIGRTKTGTPQQITAVWGDPNNTQHLNLFMTDQDGTIKSIFCTLQPGHPCWGHESADPVWFPVSDAQENNMLTPGQPITAVWRRDGSTQFSHLDLFAVGKQETGRYREFGTNVIRPIPGQDIVTRQGTVLSNIWGTFEGPNRDWGTWFPIPLRAEAIPGMDDGVKEGPGPNKINPCGQTHGLVGIISTPVIDPATFRMFVVYRTGLPLDLEEAHNNRGNLQYRADAQHWLAAVDIRTGKLLQPPVKISSTNFVSNMQLNRPALLLDSGTLYVAFGAAMCDSGGNPFQEGTPHGWVFAYDAKTLNQKGVFSTATGAPNIIAGIWQSGNGLASDSHGNVYAFTGNNNTANNTSVDYSESILRLKLPGEFNTPQHFRVREAGDLDKGGNDGDLAAGGPVLPFDNVLIGGGKQGVLYSIPNPGGQWPPSVDRFQAFYNTWISDPPPPSVCDAGHTEPISQYGNQGVGPNIHGSPVVFKPAGADSAFVYAMPEKDYLREFEVTRSGIINHCPARTTKGADNDLRSPPGMPGGFLSISANGDQDGIVWASVTCFKDREGGNVCGDASTTSGASLGRLLAFNALTLEKLWEDPNDNSPNALPFAKFVPPTVAGGHVFRAEYKDKIHVYGLR